MIKLEKAVFGKRSDAIRVGAVFAFLEDWKTIRNKNAEIFVSILKQAEGNFVFITQINLNANMFNSPLELTKWILFANSVSEVSNDIIII